MGTDIRTAAARDLAPAPEPRRAPVRKAAALLAGWMLLVGGGAAGTVWYAGQVKTSIEESLASQTESRIAELQREYDGKLAQTQADYDRQLAVLQAKVDELNELLTFAKDNASAKTDNSNKLYTQLNEVKKQLAELRKNLELLK